MASQGNEDSMFHLMEEEGDNDEDRDGSDIENLDFHSDDSDDESRHDTKEMVNVISYGTTEVLGRPAGKKKLQPRYCWSPKPRFQNISSNKLLGPDIINTT